MSAAGPKLQATMPFFASLILLAALIAAVAVPLFLGHALSAHANAYLMFAGIAALAAAALMFLLARLDRRRFERHDMR
ncbi:MAG: hypothetical protein ACRELV_17265 [Longimicrobiales bacterium]